MTDASDKVRENRLRRWAKRLGLELQKSRARKIHADDFGGWQVVDPYTDADGTPYATVVAGPNYELDLDDVEKVLADQERTLRQLRKGGSR